MNMQLLTHRPIWLSLMATALLIMAGLVYRFALMTPLSQVAQLERRFQSEQQNLNAVGAAAGLEQALRDAEARVDALTDQTSLHVDARDVDAIVPEVVRLLDTLSLNHNVRLESVVPQPQRRVEQFLELPFDVSIVGLYPDVYRWLSDAEDVLNPMTVNTFSVSSSGAEGEVSMQLQLASYRLEDS